MLSLPFLTKKIMLIKSAENKGIVIPKGINQENKGSEQFLEYEK